MVRRGGPWTGPSGSPGTRSVVGSTDRGSVFSRYPIKKAVVVVVVIKITKRNIGSLALE